MRCNDDRGGTGLAPTQLWHAACSLNSSTLLQPRGALAVDIPLELHDWSGSRELDFGDDAQWLPKVGGDLSP